MNDDSKDNTSKIVLIKSCFLFVFAPSDSTWWLGAFVGRGGRGGKWRKGRPCGDRDAALLIVQRLITTDIMAYNGSRGVSSWKLPRAVIQRHCIKE